MVDGRAGRSSPLRLLWSAGSKMALRLQLHGRKSGIYGRRPGPCSSRVAVPAKSLSRIEMGAWRSSVSPSMTGPAARW